MDIVATICGGDNWSTDTIVEAIKNGVSVFRVSSSFRTHDQDLVIINKIRNAIALSGNDRVKILHDVNKGVKKRILNRHNMDVKKGDKLKLWFKANLEKDGILIDWSDLHKAINIGTIMYVGDGEVALEVLEIEEDYALVSVKNAGVIKSRKAINVENTSYVNKAINEDNKADIIFSTKVNFDYIALSFVKSSNDLLQYREFLSNLKVTYNAKVIAKVETKEAIDNIESIVRDYDGVMIARGDLALQLDFAKLGVFQDRIIQLCYQHSKYCIVATQMLESVIGRYVPSRAEIIDITNAVKSKASACMLGPETCMNPDNIRAIQTMKRIIDEARLYY